jgi:hypothetical protein
MREGQPSNGRLIARNLAVAALRDFILKDIGGYL